MILELEKPAWVTFFATCLADKCYILNTRISSFSKTLHKNRNENSQQEVRNGSPNVQKSCADIRIMLISHSHLLQTVLCCSAFHADFLIWCQTLHDTLSSHPQNTSLLSSHLDELQDAIRWMVTFVLMDAGLVEDNGGWIGVNVVLKNTGKRHQIISGWAHLDPKLLL